MYWSLNNLGDVFGPSGILQNLCRLFFEVDTLSARSCSPMLLVRFQRLRSVSRTLLLIRIIDTLFHAKRRYKSQTATTFNCLVIKKMRGERSLLCASAIGISNLVLFQLTTFLVIFLHISARRNFLAVAQVVVCQNIAILRQHLLGRYDACPR